jgi:hypothetical protein
MGSAGMAEGQEWASILKVSAGESQMDENVLRNLISERGIPMRWRGMEHVRSSHKPSIGERRVKILDPDKTW